MLVNLASHTHHAPQVGFPHNEPVTIDINVKTGEQLNKVAEKFGSTLQSITDPQVETEDDDSETAAADDTESENKNAEQKDN